MRQAILIVISLALSLAAAQKDPVRVLTHMSFDLPEGVLERFTEETGFPVELLPAGDAGEVVNRAVLTAGRPLGDVLFGVDGSLLARAAGAGVFEPWEAPRLSGVPAEFHLSDDHLVTPVDVGYVAFNLDPGWFLKEERPLPESLDDLVRPDWKDLTVVQDPASSSTGLAFLLATVSHFGEGGDYGWLDWWADLRDNGLYVTSGWTDAYYTAFTRYGGDRPIVLSYASSPAAEVMFAEEEVTSAPTVNLLCDGCVWRQVEGAGLLAGAANPEGGRAFIDFLLSPAVQEAIPVTMSVYPVVADTTLPPEFSEYAEVPVELSGQLDPELILEKQQDWLDAWTRVVRRGADPADVR